MAGRERGGVCANRGAFTSRCACPASHSTPSPPPRILQYTTQHRVTLLYLRLKVSWRAWTTSQGCPSPPEAVGGICRRSPFWVKRGGSQFRCNNNNNNNKKWKKRRGKKNPTVIEKEVVQLCNYGVPRILRADDAVHVATGRFCDGLLRYFASLWSPPVCWLCLVSSGGWLEMGEQKRWETVKNSDPTQAGGSELRRT